MEAKRPFFFLTNVQQHLENMEERSESLFALIQPLHFYVGRREIRTFPPLLQSVKLSDAGGLRNDDDIEGL